MMDSRLPPGSRARFWWAGRRSIAGYLNAPELNRASFVNGWFKSGDIGSIDEDGFLTLHGRKNDLINRGGEKISPLEIDEALMRHPAIAEAAAFAVPHSRLGEDVAAAVVLRPGMTTTSVELRRYLQDQLASFKVPGQIVIRDQLPKGKTGKILRRQLSRSLEEKPARRKQRDLHAPPSDEDAAVNTLVAQLTEIWERLLKISPISIDDDFSEKGGDSLLAMEMLGEVERLTGRTIPTSILFEARTIRQLAQTLFDQHIQPKPLVKLNPSGESAADFPFSRGLYWRWDSTRQNSPTSWGRTSRFSSSLPTTSAKSPLMLPIEKIAADRLPLILNAQPKGPYRLYGYCLGGLVAFEVARLLVAAGEKVEMVGMIDSPTISARPLCPGACFPRCALCGR